MPENWVLNEQEVAMLLEKLNRSYARKNLIDFTQHANSRYIPNWHHFLIADRLEMLSRGDIKRLAVNMPPRHGKSELVSVHFPAWYLGNNPHKSVIAVSYNASLAADFGKKARNVVASINFKEVFPEAQLSEESAAKIDWSLVENTLHKQCPKCGTINWSKKTFGRAICRTCGALGEFAGTNTRGRYYGAGIGGGITGRGANILIIDDPIKDRKEANSETYRKNAWDWYTSAAYQRVEEGGSICICQTRWHEDDLTGRVLAVNDDDTEPWTVLSLKAIADEDEWHEIYNPDYIELLGTSLLHRKKGDALWNSRYPLKRLIDIKKVTFSKEFNAQYQQDPQTEGGGLFKAKDFRYAEATGGIIELFEDEGKTRHYYQSTCARFFTADLSIKNKEDADYTVICVWDMTKDGDLVLIDMYREQVDGADHIHILWSLYHKHKPQSIYIESTGYQSTLVQQAVKQGLPANELRAENDKKVRALPAAAKFESHKIFILKTVPDIDRIIYELTKFPHAKNDDIVDSFAYAAILSTKLSSILYAPAPAKQNQNTISNRKQFYNSLK